MRYLLLCAVLVVGCAKVTVAPGPGITNAQSGPLGVGPVSSPAEQKKVYTRAEFEALVVGKTQEEVVKAVGKPDVTHTDYWDYRKSTKDTVTGKVDSSAGVFWKDGKVDRVVY